MLKTRTWVLILGAALLLGLALCLRPHPAAPYAEIWSDGVLLETLPLDRDGVYPIETAYGTNVVTVSGGRVAVTESDCPGGDCMAQGWCSGGRPIVCLPHRLVIQFPESGGVDAVVG